VGPQGFDGRAELPTAFVSVCCLGHTLSNAVSPGRRACEPRLLAHQKWVRKILSDDQLLALGVQMKAEFDELMQAEPRNEVPMQTDTAAPV
jgi:hypothetical protein